MFFFLFFLAALIVGLFMLLILLVFMHLYFNGIVCMCVFLILCIYMRLLYFILVHGVIVDELTKINCIKCNLQ